MILINIVASVLVYFLIGVIAGINTVRYTQLRWEYWMDKESNDYTEETFIALSNSLLWPVTLFIMLPGAFLLQLKAPIPNLPWKCLEEMVKIGNCNKR